MSHKYNAEYTDTFAGDPNYCWVKRAEIIMPENGAAPVLPYLPLDRIKPTPAPGAPAPGE